MNLKANPLIVLFEYKYKNIFKMTTAVLYLTVFLLLINNPKTPLLNFV
jgi:hypothetical protein